MAVLTGKGVVASASTPDGFVVGAAPTTQSGFVKEADQTAIFVYSSNLYKIYFKDAGGNWVRHADIQQVPVNNKGLTYPWGNYTAVCFAAADPKQQIHVHIKRGTVLYDTTPEDPNDNNFALLSGAQEINIQTGNYDLPTDDGTDGQILKTDGAGNVSWSDWPTPKIYTKYLNNTRTNDNTATYNPDRLGLNSIGLATFPMYPNPISDNTHMAFRTGEDGYYRITCQATIRAANPTNDNAIEQASLYLLVPPAAPGAPGRQTDFDPNEDGGTYWRSIGTNHVSVKNLDDPADISLSVTVVVYLSEGVEIFPMTWLGREHPIIADAASAYEILGGIDQTYFTIEML